MTKDDVKKVWTQRIRNKDDKEKFERIKEELDERTRNYSDQRAGLLAIRLAYQIIDKHDSRIEDALRS